MALHVTWTIHRYCIRLHLLNLRTSNISIFGIIWNWLPLMGPRSETPARMMIIPLFLGVFNHPRWLFGILSIRGRITCLRQLDEPNNDVTEGWRIPVFFSSWSLWFMMFKPCLLLILSQKPWFFDVYFLLLFCVWSFFCCCCNALIIQKPKKTPQQTLSCLDFKESSSNSLFKTHQTPKIS